MKKELILFLSLCFLILIVGCNKPKTEQENSEIPTFIETEEETTKEEEKQYGTKTYHELNEVLERERRKCFNFFYGSANLDEDTLGYGLIPDSHPSAGVSSIAGMGYGLAALTIGVNHQYLSLNKALKRMDVTLNILETLKREHGFYYHFYYINSALPTSYSEVSVIDTGILMCGLLVAGKYFGGEYYKRALKLYEEVDWPWYVNPNTNQFYMSYDAKTGKHSGAWNTYAEQLMLYFLGAGSKTHPTDLSVYESFKRMEGSYEDYKFIHSWFGSLFTYQFSHAFIDFRNMVDKDGIDWYQNSVLATKANQAYAIDQSRANGGIYQTFHQYSWGMTACDGPKGYSGLYGAPPSGSYNNAHHNDGTVCLAGALGSLVFTPEIVIPTANYYYNFLDGKLFGGYGFYDSYNLENGVWISNIVLSIDKGITLMMIENYQTELIWEVFMDLELMDKAIEVLKFTAK